MLLMFLFNLFHSSFDNTRTGKKSILESVGILVDEVSNSVITYNLGGNELLDNFKKNLTPLTINMANIRKMKTIKAENDVLLIIENPSFLSKIIEKKINYSVIITSGNSNFVVYKLIEKIENVIINFNGDYDPEGLLIAQKFKDKYPSLNFIGYNEDFYYHGLSSSSINSSRLKKLDAIVDENLKIIKNLLIEKKIASYQEVNYDKILEEMNEKY